MQWKLYRAGNRCNRLCEHSCRYRKSTGSAFGILPVCADELCANACNGFITAIPSGGTLPYTYSWNPTGQNTQTATNLCGGTYTVTITDANGCTLVQSDTINSPVVLVMSAPVVTDATCNNSPDGAIILL